VNHKLTYVATYHTYLRADVADLIFKLVE